MNKKTLIRTSIRTSCRIMSIRNPHTNTGVTNSTTVDAVGAVTGTPIDFPGFKNATSEQPMYPKQPNMRNDHDYETYSNTSPCLKTMTEILRDERIPEPTRLEYEIKMLGRPWQELYGAVKQNMEQMMMKPSTKSGQSEQGSFFDIKDNDWGVLQCWMIAKYDGQYVKKFRIYMYINGMEQGWVTFNPPYDASAFMVSTTEAKDLALTREAYEQTDEIRYHFTQKTSRIVK